MNERTTYLDRENGLLTLIEGSTTPPKLGQFIHDHHKTIIGEWVQFASTIHPWSEGMTRKALEDHAEELLTAIVSDMEGSQSSLQRSEKAQGRASAGALTSIGQKHASDRLETGFKLDQLVSEYRALRASVVRLWAEAHGDKQGELTRFNEAIDETLAEAAVRYSELMNRTREQFLAILAHDLRNPLGAIVMGAQALTRSESLDDKHARVATRILNSAGRMDRMVSYLLDLARTRLGGSIPLTPTRMDLASVCHQVIAELEVVHPERHVRFEAKGDLSGEWDSDRLTQVISNLVANALQYGKAAVSVAAEEHGEDVVLRVHNDGPAIPQSALKNLFEPMVRQPAQSGDRNAGGLGLGLYIAREVVTAHGGTIDVTSSEKEGTTFAVQLPRRPPKGKAHSGRSPGNGRRTDDSRE